MVDKPGVITLDELAEVRRVQAETGRIFSVCFSERFENRATAKASRARRGRRDRHGRADRRPRAARAAQQPAAGLVLPARALRRHPVRHRRAPVRPVPALHRLDARPRSWPRTSPTTPIRTRRSWKTSARCCCAATAAPATSASTGTRPKGLRGVGRRAADDPRHRRLHRAAQVHRHRPAGPAATTCSSSTGRASSTSTAATEPLPYGARLIADVLDRTETAMPQAHCFLATELALKAEAMAVRVGRKVMSTQAARRRGRCSASAQSISRPMPNCPTCTTVQGRLRPRRRQGATPRRHSSASLADTARSPSCWPCPDLDVIDLCTPPNTHRGLIEQALAAGLHVVCEKPLIGSLADVDAVASGAARRQGPLFPIFQYRFGNGLQKLKHLQAKGLCGHALTSRRSKPHGGATRLLRDAVARQVGHRAGRLLPQRRPIHAHDILSYVNGPVKTVFASSRPASTPSRSRTARRSPSRWRTARWRRWRSRSVRRKSCRGCASSSAT